MVCLKSNQISLIPLNPTQHYFFQETAFWGCPSEGLPKGILKPPHITWCYLGYNECLVFVAGPGEAAHPTTGHRIWAAVQQKTPGWHWPHLFSRGQVWICQDVVSNIPPGAVLQKEHGPLCPQGLHDFHGPPGQACKLRVACNQGHCWGDGMHTCAFLGC